MIENQIKISVKYDFAVIDTAHIHPMETLNFLCVLPYLNDGAVVVLHDTSLHIYNANSMAVATRILMSTVAAHKIEPNVSGTFPPNIAAFQVTQDTRKYVENIFSSLFLPWGMVIDASIINSIRILLEKHYDKKLVAMFDGAYLLAENFRVSNQESYIETTAHHYANLPTDTIFYGAGLRMREELNRFAQFNVQFNFKIWDNNPANKQCNGNLVTLPCYEAAKTKGQVIIVTIHDIHIFNEVKALFEPLGYKVVRNVLQA
jgi:hypothetical protein